jgi:cytochrome c-type biogenesis protein CcmH/NrfG
VDGDGIINLARAAEQALKNGQYSVAVDYAQRAAQAAPNDPQLWFLLGYAARLAGKSQLSIDAFNHGLKLEPSSLDGISGLAQTYARVGKSDEAERLLTQVLSADPKRTTDAGILGELYLRSGQYDKTLSVLGRAEDGEARGCALGIEQFSAARNRWPVQDAGGSASEDESRHHNG